MNEFEKDLINVMGNFMEVNLDCVERQNREIEKLQKDIDDLVTQRKRNEKSRKKTTKSYG